MLTCHGASIINNLLESVVRPSLCSVLIYCICEMKRFLFPKMRAVELAEMLRELLEAKINKCTRQMRSESTIPIEEVSNCRR
jgi:hypothetical protein